MKIGGFHTPTPIHDPAVTLKKAEGTVCGYGGKDLPESQAPRSLWLEAARKLYISKHGLDISNEIPRTLRVEFTRGGESKITFSLNGITYEVRSSLCTARSICCIVPAVPSSYKKIPVRRMTALVELSAPFSAKPVSLLPR